MTVTIFDLKSCANAQVVEALTCPINRHCTRRVHDCDDWELFKHQEWLTEHYNANGGPVMFARRRAEFIRTVEVPDEDFQI